MNMDSNKLTMNHDDSIITKDEIRLILDQYRIGKKPLAKLLGWGETTIIRYMEGDTPTSEYSSKLKTILEDPEYYYDLLCKRKHCLTSVAYKKSRNAVLSKIMASKLYGVAYYIVNKTKADICPAYVQYLLYYSQAFYLAFYDREFFQEECVMNQTHTPYKKLYESMKRCGVNEINIGDDFLLPEDRFFVDDIMDAFFWYGPKTLTSMMDHEISEINLVRDRYNNQVLSKDSLKAYFKEILHEYDIKNPKEVGKYPDRRILEIRNIEVS